MPEEYKAESAVVQPKPATYEAIDALLNAQCQAVELQTILAGYSAGANYVGGLQGGIALAIDNPEAARLVLAAIDAGKREDAVANRALDPDEDIRVDAQNRAEAMKDLADAAMGVTGALPESPGSEFLWN